MLSFHLTVMIWTQDTVLFVVVVVVISITYTVPLFLTFTNSRN